jgi:hypothetical protein
MTITSQNDEREVSTQQGAQSGCCGGAAPKGVDACCALDAEVKSEGGSGCGCAAKSASAVRPGKSCC